MKSYPSEEGHGEERPLHPGEHAKQLDGIRNVQHRRLKRREARLDVGARRHALIRSAIVVLGAGPVDGTVVCVNHDGEMASEESGDGKEKTLSRVSTDRWRRREAVGKQVRVPG